MLSKYKSLRAHKEGFTIIEVIIVLVIGTIIMGAVFLVVPQLQRTQRNSRRLSDARRVLATAEQFSANNQGLYPTQTPPSGSSINTACATTLDSANCPSIINLSGPIPAPGADAYSIKTITTPGDNDMTMLYNSSTVSCTNGVVGTASAPTGKFVLIVRQENNTATPTYTCVSN